MQAARIRRHLNSIPIVVNEDEHEDNEEVEVEKVVVDVALNKVALSRARATIASARADGFGMPHRTSYSLLQESQTSNRCWRPGELVAAVVTSKTTNGRDAKVVVEVVVIVATAILKVGAAAMAPTPKRTRKHSRDVQPA